jgi:hypothetical protein
MDKLHLSGFALLLMAASWSAPTSAQTFDRSHMFSDRQLDTVRGGVDTGGGLLGSFGIDRATFINGQLVAHTSVFIPDIAHVTPQQATALAAAMRTVVIQNGPGNAADPASFSSTPGALVIQNSLDKQNIQNLTSIHATVNTLPMFNALNLQDALQSGLVQSIGH